MDKTFLTPSNIPCLTDADLSLLPQSQIQSGIGYQDDLQLQEIVQLTPLHWAPVVKRGFYYSGLEGHYLHADGAVRLIPRQTTSLVLPLPISPQEGEPVSVVTYFREEDGRIREGYRWRQKVRFSGTLATEGDRTYEQVDLDNNGQVINYNLAYADQSRTEFVLRRYTNCTTRVQLPADLGANGPGLVEVPLDPPALPSLPVLFTNQTMFRTRVDTAPVQAGEWSLSSDGDTLLVYLAAVPVDAGQMIYHHQPPADLLFARDYTLQHGQLTTPQVMAATEILGISDGSASQCFFCRYFPVFSRATTKVFVETSGIISTWNVVADLNSYGGTDLVCALDLDQGLLRFGDGEHGYIPPAGSRIGIVYTSVPLIQYEVQPSQVYTGREVNLHPLITPVHRGFLYLGQQVDILHSLTLSCDKAQLNTGAYGPLYCGNDYATLTCTATNSKGEPIPDLLIEFVTGDYGYFSQLPRGVNVQKRTLADGKARVIFHPPGNIMEMAEVVDLYSPEGNFLNPYQTIVNNNDALTITPNDLGGTSQYDEALTFLLLDDDPMLPYNTYRRRGGGLVLLYHLDEATTSFVPTKPLPVENVDYLQYPYSLPTPTHLPSLRKFVVAIPKIVTIYCRAYDPLSGREIRSNPITLLIKAPAFQVGPYTVKKAKEQTPGSAVGAATYLTINQQGGLDAFFWVGEKTDGGEEEEEAKQFCIYPVYGYWGNGVNRDRYYSLQTLMSPDGSFIITHEWDYIHDGIWFQKISTSTKQVISGRFMGWPETCQTDGICAEDSDNCTGYYQDYFGWHHPACMDELGRVYAASCDGFGRVYRLNSDTWQWEARSPIHPMSNYTTKHPGWDPDHSFVSMKLARVSLNPAYPYLWLNTASMVMGALGPMRVYLINRETMANPYDSNDWAYAITPPAAMTDDGSYDSDGYAKPGAFCLDDTTGRCYIMWTDAYCEPEEWFLSRFDPTTQEYISVNIGNIIGLDWRGAWAHMGYDPVSGTLVLYHYGAHEGEFVTKVEFFNSNLSHIKTINIYDVWPLGDRSEDNFIGPANSKFYICNDYGGLKEDYVKIYEIDCLTRTVNEVGRHPYGGSSNLWNLHNMAYCAPDNSWYCEVSYDRYETGYDDSILREVKLCEDTSGVYPVPDVDNKECSVSAYLGDTENTCLLVTPDEKEIIEIHTALPDPGVPWPYPWTALSLKGGITAVSQSVMGSGQVLYSFAVDLMVAGVPNGNPVGKVYAHTGTFGSSGKPTGSPLAVSASAEVGGDAVKFVLQTPILLENNTPYCLVVEHTGGTSNNYYWTHRSNSDVYPGNVAYYENGTWTALNYDIGIMLNPSPDLVFADAITVLRRIDIDSRAIAYERIYRNPELNCAVLSDNSNCYNCYPIFADVQSCDMDENGNIYAISCEGYGPLVKLRKSDFEAIANGYYKNKREDNLEFVRVSRNPNYPYAYSWYYWAASTTNAVYLHHRNTLQNPFDQETTESKYPAGWQEAGMQYDPFGFYWWGPYYFTTPRPYRQYCVAGDIDNNDGGLWMVWYAQKVNPSDPIYTYSLVKYLPNGTQLGPWDMTNILDGYAVGLNLTFDENSNQLIFYSKLPNKFIFVNATTKTLIGMSPTFPDIAYSGCMTTQRGVINGKIMGYANMDEDENLVYKLYLVDVSTRQITKTVDLKPYVMPVFLRNDRLAERSLMVDGLYIDRRKSAFILLKQRGSDLQEAVGFFEPFVGPSKSRLAPVTGVIHPRAADDMVIGMYNEGAVFLHDEKTLIVNCAWQTQDEDLATRWFKIDAVNGKLLAVKDYFASDFPNCTITLNYPFTSRIGFDADEQGNIYSILCNGTGKVCRLSPNNFDIIATGTSTTSNYLTYVRIHAVRNAAYPYLWITTRASNPDAVWLLHRDTLSNPFNGLEYGFLFTKPSGMSTGYLVGGAVNHVDGSIWTLWLTSDDSQRWLSCLYPDGTRYDANISSILPNPSPYYYGNDSMTYDLATDQLIVSTSDGTIYFINTHGTISLNGTLSGAYDPSYPYQWQRGVVGGYLYLPYNTSNAMKIRKVNVNTRTVAQEWDLTSYLEDDLAQIVGPLYCQVDDSILFFCRDSNSDLQKFCPSVQGT